jgi:hypothetical protein
MTLLCDDITKDQHLVRCYDANIKPVLAKITQAQKFVLTKEFAVASEGLIDNLTELDRVAPFCRLPYPLCWFEWLQADRPKFLTLGRPVDRERFQRMPHRIGMLCEQCDRASQWITYLFWSLIDVSPEAGKFNTSIMIHMFDTERTNPDNLSLIYYASGPRGTAAKDESSLLYAMVTPHLAAFSGPLLKLGAGKPELLQELITLSAEDWGGEVRFLFALLGLLNCRNVPLLETVDKTEHNRKRNRRGMLPLFSHIMLKLHPLRKRDLTPQASDEHHHGELRSHFVRGHFKQRKSGLYWWSMHRRGDPTRGTVEKEYQIET